MSTTTTNFDLFKYDTTADAQTAFSITNALNNNWDKLDANCVKRGSTTDATGSTTRPVYVDASGQIQPCANEIPAGDFLTATTSLAENGYIKFSNNICFFYVKGVKPAVGANSITQWSYTLPIAITNLYSLTVCVNNYTHNAFEQISFISNNESEIIFNTYNSQRQNSGQGTCYVLGLVTVT